MTHEDVRAQLTEAMERRRVELGLTWRQIAAKSGLSIEALRSVRKERREITPPTRRALEIGLEWPRGHVTAILESKLASDEAEPELRDDVERQLWAIKELGRDKRLDWIRLYRQQLAQEDAG
ncbi:hypothetical protein [Amycolatopsis pigmentata]|uniref:XRE family transcriptional regulator n=1 Tax=Amycolatopsis pigmentata TaxID=450801 RepID=A0ABW5G3X1_9PSEU